MLSRLVFGTGSGYPNSQVDFQLYNALKYAVLSGGFNHIDTGSHFRFHRSERVVGCALRTLFDKYNVERDELFINSKQGMLLDDTYNQLPAPFLMKEMLANLPGLTEDDFIKNQIATDQQVLTCLHPAFLNATLNKTLATLNLGTLDCALLFDPFEVSMQHSMAANSNPDLYEEKYYAKLARAFEFYESCVADGRLRSYGITG